MGEAYQMTVTIIHGTLISELEYFVRISNLPLPSLNSHFRTLSFISGLYPSFLTLLCSNQAPVLFPMLRFPFRASDLFPSFGSSFYVFLIFILCFTFDFISFHVHHTCIILSLCSYMRTYHFTYHSLCLISTLSTTT